MVGQHHRAIRPAEHSREIDDFQAEQGAGGLHRGAILDGGSLVHAAASFECLSAGFGIDFEHLIAVRVSNIATASIPLLPPLCEESLPQAGARGSVPDSRVGVSDAMIG